MITFCPRCGTGSYESLGTCKQCGKHERASGPKKTHAPDEACFSMCALCGITTREYGRPPKACGYCGAEFPKFGRLHPAFTQKRGTKPGYW